MLIVTINNFLALLWKERIIEVKVVCIQRCPHPSPAGEGIEEFAHPNPYSIMPGSVSS